MKVNEWPESQDKDPTRGVVKTGTHSGVGSAAAHFSKTARRPKKKSSTPSKRQPKLKLLRRMEQIENLPPYRQRALLTTIDSFLAASPDR